MVVCCVLGSGKGKCYCCCAFQLWLHCSDGNLGTKGGRQTSTVTRLLSEGEREDIGLLGAHRRQGQAWRRHGQELDPVTMARAGTCRGTGRGGVRLPVAGLGADNCTARQAVASGAMVPRGHGLGGVAELRGVVGVDRVPLKIDVAASASPRSKLGVGVGKGRGRHRG